MTDFSSAFTTSEPEEKSTKGQDDQLKDRFDTIITDIADSIVEDEDDGDMRMKNGEPDDTPIVIFINGAEALEDPSSKDWYRKYCTLMEKGKSVRVYFVLLFQEFSPYYNGRSNTFNAKDVIITASADGDEVVNHLKTLKVEPRFLANSLKVNPLELDSLVLLIDDGVPTRVMVPLYGDGYVESMVKNLYDEEED